jgi:hypothetical protein
MANKSIFETLTQYRLKVEKDGKAVVNVPGLFALPGLLMAPKLSITGLIAAPLLGLKVHLESESGEPVDVEGAVRKAAEAVKDSVTSATKTIKDELDKAWDAASSDNPEEGAEDTAAADAEANAEESAEDTASADAEADAVNNTEENAESRDTSDVSNKAIVEELEKHEEDDIPAIEVKPEDSSRA